MAKKKRVGKALLTSTIALILTFSMFIGTTFAWFTDSVSSANNQIVAGNLDVELYYQVEDETTWEKVTSSTNVFMDTLWEPGHTEVVKFKTVNEGSLALKYQLGVYIASQTTSWNVYNEEFKLSDYIMYGIVDGEIDYASRTEAVEAVEDTATTLNVAYNSGTTMLTVDDTTTTDVYENEDVVTMVVYMPEEVENVANMRKGADVPMIQLGVSLVATQVAAEDDSFGPDYDDDAWLDGFEVTNANDLQAALNNGETDIVLNDDIFVDKTIVIPAPTTEEIATMSMRTVAKTSGTVVINLNGNTISSVDKNVIRNDGATVVIENGTIERTGTAVGYAVYNASGALTVNNLTVNCGLYSSGSSLVLNNANVSHHQSSRHAIYAWDCEVTINGGNYHNDNPGNATIMSAGTSVVTINGGTFSIADGRSTLGWTSCMLDSNNTAKFVLNDGTFNGGFRVNGSSTMIVNGGTFNDVYGSGYNVYSKAIVYGGVFTDTAAKNFANKNIANGCETETDENGNLNVCAAIKTVEELQEAVNNAVDGESIVFGQSVEGVDGVLITDKNITIDLNGFTFTVSEGANTNNRNFKVVGTSNVTIKNGTLIAEGELTSGAYGTVRAEDTANVTLSNLELYSYRGYGLNVKANGNSKIVINDTQIYAQYSGGVEAVGGEIELNNVTINQVGVYSSAAWCSVAIGVNSGGKVTVNSGNYSASTIESDANAAQGTWAAYVMTSGGDLIINGGTFTSTVAATASDANACGVICADRAAVVTVNGGTFNSSGAIFDMRNNLGTQPNPVVTLNGGTYSSDPRVSGLYSSDLIKVSDGCSVVNDEDGSWSISRTAWAKIGENNYDSLQTALANATNGDTIVLLADVEDTVGITIPEGVTLDGGNHKITYVGKDDTYHLVKLNTGSALKNVNLKNYRARTESTTNGVVTLENVVIDMDNDATGLDISRGAGTAILKKVVCKGTKDVAHLDPNTQVQVDYTPYGDVLLGGAWALEATDCEFGSLHGWNTRNGSYVKLNNTTYTVFRMHYWSMRTLYINGVETAWSESGAIPVAHDVGGCWSVQPAFK